MKAKQQQLDLDLPGNNGPLFEQPLKMSTHMEDGGMGDFGIKKSILEEIKTEPIRALSWWQPFGTAMLYGKVECREWPTSYRGLVLICTTQTPFFKQSVNKRIKYNFAISHLDEIQKLHVFEERQVYDTMKMNGWAIAIGRIAECRLVHPSDNTYFLHWPGLFAHVYQDVRRIKPFEYKGSQKWGTVTATQKAKIKLL